MIVRVDGMEIEVSSAEELSTVMQTLRGDAPAPPAAPEPNVPADVEPEPALASVHAMPAPRRIALSSTLVEALNVVMTFPEGITSRGIATLLGIPPTAASTRVQKLKLLGMVSKVPGHKMWVATELARTSHIVAA